MGAGGAAAAGWTSYPPLAGAAFSGRGVDLWLVAVTLIGTSSMLGAINFLVTNWVSSAGHFYGAQFGFEPAGQVTEKGIVCRIFNATATGDG